MVDNFFKEIFKKWYPLGNCGFTQRTIQKAWRAACLILPSFFKVQFEIYYTVVWYEEEKIWNFDVIDTN